MSFGRLLISWMAAAQWFAAGLVVVASGFFLTTFVVVGLASLAVALLVAVAPLKPISLMSTALAIVFAVLSLTLWMIEPTTLAIAATLTYLAAAFLSFGAYRYETKPRNGPAP